MRRRNDATFCLGVVRAGAVVVGCLAIANCSSSKLSSKVDPKYGVTASPRVVEPGQPVPKGGGAFRVGKPYMVAGRMYYPEENTRYRNEGVASWYGDDFHGRLTANGEVYDMEGISAAHPTLPMPCYVRVTNLSNQKSLIVRVNDRGPYHGNREIDLSGKASELLGFRGRGLVQVRVEYVGTAPLEGSDDRMLAATFREGGPAPLPSNVMVASAKPFLPQSSVRGSPIGDNVPVPMGRPYDLGDGSPGQSAAAATATRTALVRRTSPTEMAAARGSSIQSQLLGTPVTSYAPVRTDGVAASTGRGLY